MSFPSRRTRGFRTFRSGRQVFQKRTDKPFGLQASEPAASRHWLEVVEDRADQLAEDRAREREKRRT